MSDEELKGLDAWNLGGQSKDLFGTNRTQPTIMDPIVNWVKTATPEQRIALAREIALDNLTREAQRLGLYDGVNEKGPRYLVPLQPKLPPHVPPEVATAGWDFPEEECYPQHTASINILPLLQRLWAWVRR